MATQYTIKRENKQGGGGGEGGITWRRFCPPQENAKFQSRVGHAVAVVVTGAAARLLA